MVNTAVHEKENQLDLMRFLSRHSEAELVELKIIVERLLLEKTQEGKGLIFVPVSIFSKGLNPGEALVKFLKENKSLRLCEISRILDKKENVLWLNYRRGIKKFKAGFVIDDNESGLIPVSVFCDSRLSYLESIVIYLRESLHISNKECARILGKSPQVLSIAYTRGKSKLKNG